jgi:hypothetical protein
MLDAMELMAPCGMNCRLCYAYQRTRKHCPGCRGDDAGKAVSCLKCIIKNCEFINQGRSKFCYECGKYPCRRLKQLDKRYRTKYGMSMIENLNSIKEIGLKAFVEKQNKRWRCARCGGVICVHKGHCLACGV